MALMTKKRYFQIAREYGLSNKVIESQWNERPSGNICEDNLRKSILRYIEVDKSRHQHVAIVSAIISHMGIE